MVNRGHLVLPSGLPHTQERASHSRWLCSRADTRWSESIGIVLERAGGSAPRRRAGQPPAQAHTSRGFAVGSQLA
jgi:hypothetical protein